MSETKQKLTELLASLSGEDKTNIEEAVNALVDEVQTATKAEIQAEHAKTQEMITRITEQRDINLNRAQEAEIKLVEVTVENSKLAEASQVFEAQLDETNGELTNLQHDYSELEASLAEKLQAQFDEEMTTRVRKISRFLDSRMSVVAEAIRDEMAKDPLLAKENAAYRRIVDLVGEVANTGTGDILTHPEYQTLQAETAGLRSQVKTLTAKCTRLNEENRTQQENNGSKGPNLNDWPEDLAASFDAFRGRVNSPIRVIPVGSDKEIEITLGEYVLNPDKYVQIPSWTTKNETTTPKTPSKNLDPALLDTPVTESVVTQAPVTAPTTEPRKSRASELLREHFAKRSAVTSATDQKPLRETAPGGWVDGGSPATTLQENRATRVERASSVTGKGELINEEDILSETSKDSSRKKNAPDMDKIVPGTDQTLREVLTLAGVSTDD